MGRWPGKHVIGLTGNIAVGKSVVRQMLQHLGAHTVDADGLTHQAMAQGAPGYQPVIDMFGRFLLDDKGNINRSILGHIVFTYPDAMAKLEAIVHPVVLYAINTLISRASQRVIVVEAIKLLETDLANAVDSVWVVNASPEAQLKRLTDPGKRRMSDDEARRRIAAQGAQMEKLSRANVIINNDGSVEDTWKQVQAAWNDLQKQLGGTSTAPQSTSIPTAAPPTPAPATPPPAQAKPAAAPAVPAVAAPPRPAPANNAAPISVTVRRGMPNNAGQIAEFITNIGGKPTDRMDIMLSFGQKSYLLAQDNADNRVVALIGWQVENLITRADEFYMEPTNKPEPVITALVNAIETASRELQSEVAFILLPPTTTQDTVQSFVDNGYEVTTLEGIRIPAWRESVQEIYIDASRVLTKKLRADRVMKPI